MSHIWDIEYIYILKVFIGKNPYKHIHILKHHRIHTHTYIYVYIRTYTHVYTHIYTYIYKHTHTYKYVDCIRTIMYCPATATAGIRGYNNVTSRMLPCDFSYITT